MASSGAPARVPAFLAFVFLLAAAGPLRAAPVSLFDVTLESLIGSVSFNDVSVVDGPEITSADTDILLPNEFVDVTLQTDHTWSIVIGLQGLGDQLTTGNIGPGATYAFSDFRETGGTSVLLAAVSSGLEAATEAADFAAPTFTNSPTPKITVPISGIDLGPEEDCADEGFCGRINLAVEFEAPSQVPEPSTYLLLAAGLLGLVRFIRRTALTQA